MYNLAFRLDMACKYLPPPVDAMDVYPGSTGILQEILDNGPSTFQSKPSNLAQIKSLMDCVCRLVISVRERGIEVTTPMILDIGAGKALLTRAVYEALGREVSVVALDSRRSRAKDQFYDPPPAQKIDSSNASSRGNMPYTRIVADVRYLAARTMVPLREAKDGGVIVITKHLCGGATDGSLKAICEPPLARYVGACCLAPCCHQKTKKEQYCNIPYLESIGFCKTHIGMRGGVQDNDFRNLGMLISISRATELHEYEYKKSILLDLLGFSRAKDLGRKARRLMEEGRIRYLRDRGFNAYLVRYCDESITGDNLAIIATKPS